MSNRLRKLWHSMKTCDARLVFALLLPVSLWIGCSHYSESGPLWPDGPQYANAAAMIHDWLQSGQILHPYEFAKQNYARLPAFHLPYHPPFYPGLLGLFFMVTGVSYFSARVFVAICLWLSGCFCYLILTESRLRKPIAAACSLLLITLPEVAFWSRDTMSEVPALWLILAASYFFLIWLNTDRKAAYWAAFGIAMAAFLSRFLTAGILPAWFVWTLLAGKVRKIMAPWAILPPLLYGMIGGLWTAAAIRFSRYETMYGGSPPTTNYAGAGSLKVVAYYASRLPAMTGWPVLVLACLGLFCIIRLRKKTWRDLIWIPWLLSYVIFVELVGIYQEQRYFIYALPALVGMIAAGAHTADTRFGRYLVPAATAICLLWNVATITTFPHGLVGYETIGRELARMGDRGNILISSVGQADLIFRYRSQPAAPPRSFIRADRTLVIRPPAYSSAAVKVIARNSDDVLEIIRRGRVRYLVTCSPADGDPEARTNEMALLDDVAGKRPDRFQLLGVYAVNAGHSKESQPAKVRLWKFTGEVPDGSSEIGVVVPTADFTIAPPK